MSDAWPFPSAEAGRVDRRGISDVRQAVSNEQNFASLARRLKKTAGREREGGD